MKHIYLAMALLSAPLAASAQEAPLKPEFNRHSVVEQRDRLVPASMGGVMAGFAGRPWWQALAYCVGVYGYQAELVEKQGNAAQASQIVRDMEAHFVGPALQRLATDRGISLSDAKTAMAPEVSFQSAFAADEGRPFAAESARCRVIAARAKTASQSPT